MIGERQLDTMKPAAFLINTARGGIADEAAVKAALRAGRLGGAAFDVFLNEPPIDQELIQMANVIATPHIGGSTDEAVLAMGRAAIAGLERSPDSIDLTANVTSPRI
jgi:D-3-phosphoglycerate dehydrogenase